MRLGIGTYCYMWNLGFGGVKPHPEWSAIRLLDEARRLGVRVIQFGPNRPLSDLPPSDLDTLLGAASSAGLELELGTKGLDPDLLADQVRFTRRCGASLLRTVPAERPDSPRFSLPQLESSLRQLLPVLEGESVTLAIENALIPARGLKSLVESLASPFIGVTLDTVNSMAIGEGVRDVAQTLGPYTRCLHIKDFAAAREWHMMGFRIEGRPAGSGQLDIPWLLTQVPASANAILELWVPEQPSLDQTRALELDWVDQSIAALRLLIPEDSL